MTLSIFIKHHWRQQIELIEASVPVMFSENLKLLLLKGKALKKGPELSQPSGGGKKFPFSLPSKWFRNVLSGFFSEAFPNQGVPNQGGVA